MISASVHLPPTPRGLVDSTDQHIIIIIILVIIRIHHSRYHQNPPSSSRRQSVHRSIARICPRRGRFERYTLCDNKSIVYMRLDISCSCLLIGGALSRFLIHVKISMNRSPERNVGLCGRVRTITPDNYPGQLPPDNYPGQLPPDNYPGQLPRTTTPGGVSHVPMSTCVYMCWAAYHVARAGRGPKPRVRCCLPPRLTRAIGYRQSPNCTWYTSTLGGGCHPPGGTRILIFCSCPAVIVRGVMSEGVIVRRGNCPG